ncbi:hypothetical protein N7507_003107 [Penicillium longicatenatum]|nr:hypothetical protein N7507_003107 [Penicillium longicatenatum]
MSAEGSAAISPSTSVQVSLFSYGHANGPIVQQHREARYHKTLHYNIRHLPNPPRHLRAKSTGLSRRLQKEFLHNTNVEEFLVKVQGELLNAIKQGCGQLLHSTEQKGIERRPCETDERSDTSAHSSEVVTDIDVVVTICCEEGHHRSVAFVEELARRLAMFKQGDGLSQRWLLSVDATHRDIEELEDNGQPPDQHKRPNKPQEKSRQMGRRQKVDRYKSPLENDDGES